MNGQEPEPHIVRQTQASMISLSPAQASRTLARMFGTELKSSGNQNFERVRYTTFTYGEDSAVMTWTYSILSFAANTAPCCLVVTRELSLDEFPPHYQPAVIDHFSDQQFAQELGRWLKEGAGRPHPLRVLIVGKDQPDSDVLAAKITEQISGAAVVCVSSTAQALKTAVADQPFDVVITDYDWGRYNLSGFGLIRKLQSEPTYGTDFHPVVLHPYTDDHIFAGQAKMLGADWFNPGRTDMLMNRLQGVNRQLCEAAELI